MSSNTPFIFPDLTYTPEDGRRVLHPDSLGHGSSRDTSGNSQLFMGHTANAECSSGLQSPMSSGLDYSDPEDMARLQNNRPLESYSQLVPISEFHMRELKMSGFQDTFNSFGLPTPTEDKFRWDAGFAPSSTRTYIAGQDSAPASAKEVPAGPSTQRKTRREKPNIELAADQPPTTQGKPRQRVFVACAQCRSRKIRCDGAKPICFNCGRRSDSFQCSYDAAPKRRGPDRQQGTRQRTVKDPNSTGSAEDTGTRPRRRRSETNSNGSRGSVGASEWTDGAEHPSSTVPRMPDLFVLPPTPITATPHADVSPFLNEAPFSGPVSVSNIRTSALPSRGRGLHVRTSNVMPIGKISQAVRTEPNGSTSQITPYPGRLGLELPVAQERNPPRANATFHPVSFISTSGIVSVSEDGQEEEDELKASIAAEPSLAFTRKTWWDSLLTLYASQDQTLAHRSYTLTAHQRDVTGRRITDDLRFLFRHSNYWFSFFNVPCFFANFLNPRRRENMQPSLILAALAVATFLQSSEADMGETGRDRALRLRDEAQGAFEASLNAQWIDSSVAQAAWLLAFFEVCAHRSHSTERATSAMIILDAVIRSLSLTFLDADDPRASVFSPHAEAVNQSDLASQQRLTQSSSNSSGNLSSFTVVRGPVASNTQYLPSDVRTPPRQGCSCAALALGNNWRFAKEFTPLWLSTAAWDDNWSEAEVRKEECRRLCWSTLYLAAGHSSYTWANKSRGLELFAVDPANYALLMPGESLARSPSFAPYHPGKESIWALHIRIMLLWNSCLRMRCDRTMTDAQKAQFAMKAWLSADTIEEALNKHTCDMEKAYMYMGREYLFNTRMCISYEYQRYIPQAAADFDGIFHRRKADEWLSHQTLVAQRVMQGLHKVTGLANNVLARRPFFVFHFMSQVSRTLTLWSHDHSYIEALEVSKALLPPIDYLSALWPCKEQRSRYERIRAQLTDACYVAGISIPAAPNVILPSPGNPETMI